MPKGTFTILRPKTSQRINDSQEIDDLLKRTCFFLKSTESEMLRYDHNDADNDSRTHRRQCHDQSDNIRTNSASGCFCKTHPSC